MIAYTRSVRCRSNGESRAKVIAGNAPAQDITAPSVSLLVMARDSREVLTTRPLSRALSDMHLDIGERILIAGGTPEEIMLTCERCRERGLAVGIDAGNFPTLRRSLGQRLGAFDVVLLDTAGTRSKQIAFRARDIICALTALALLFPFFLVIALLIVSTSSGPLFYCAEVVGRDERRFKWRKFRSMSPVSPEEDRMWRQAQYQIFMNEGTGSVPGSALKKVVNLQRVTRIGAILRKHSIDELPQFWHVLYGDMTLVGPRPALPYEHECFADWQRLRVAGITPGLTGPWQAYGRSRVSFDEMVLLDYCYGHCRSFFLDIRLMIRTISVMVTGEGGQ